jgi:hypothetical protein
MIVWSVVTSSSREYSQMVAYDTMDQVIRLQEIDILAVIGWQMHRLGPVALSGPFSIHGDESMSRVDVVPQRISLSEVLVRVLCPPVETFPLRRKCLNAR